MPQPTLMELAERHVAQLEEREKRLTTFLEELKKRFDLAKVDLVEVKKELTAWRSQMILGVKHEHEGAAEPAPIEVAPPEDATTEKLTKAPRRKPKLAAVKR